MFTTGLTQQAVLASVQGNLKALRDILATVQELQAWAAGITLADLQGAPLDFPQGDAQSILSALADANGLAMIYSTGIDPRNPGAGYVYANSQRQVIGPV